MGAPDIDLAWDIGGDGAMGSVSVTVADTDGDASLPSSVPLVLATIPIVLGSGIPLFASGAPSRQFSVNSVRKLGPFIQSHFTRRRESSATRLVQYNEGLELRGAATSARSRCCGADTRGSGLTDELSSLFVDTSTLGHEALGPVDADSWSGFRRSVGRIPCLDVCFIDLSESLFVETHRRSDFRYVCVERYQIVCPRNCQIVLCDNRLQGLLGYIVGSGMRRYRSSPDHS